MPSNKFINPIRTVDKIKEVVVSMVRKSKMLSVIHRSRALMAMIKRPRVRRMIGAVIIFRIGLMVKFKKARNNPAVI